MSTTNILDLNNRVDELEKNSGGGGSADSAKRSDIATEFSATTAYTAGCFVYHEGKLYQFNADHSAGAWDPTDVVEANVTDQIVSNYNTFKDYTEKSDIAPTFSDVANYNKGDLVYYEGSLYQFTADHTAGAWTGTDAQQIDISDIVNGIPVNLSNIKITKLWENSTPSASFPAGDIPVNLNGYDLILTLASNGISCICANELTGTINLNELATAGSGLIGRRRLGAITATGITFYDAYYANSFNTGSVDNTLLKPLFIYGLNIL